MATRRRRRSRWELSATCTSRSRLRRSSERCSAASVRSEALRAEHPRPPPHSRRAHPRDAALLYHTRGRPVPWRSPGYGDAPRPSLPPMKIALVHDYLNQEGGAERVARVFCLTYPGSPLYTSVYDPACMDPFWRTVDVRTSFMQPLGPSLRVAKVLLPLYPLAFEAFDF